MTVTERELEAAILALEVLPPAQGPRGPQGPQGERGPEGPKGADGQMGPEGPDGPVGEQGLMGLRGIQGIQGIEGPEGPTGPRGPMGIEGPEGPRGPQGWLGPDGPRGEKGDRGEKGERGERGLAGRNGWGGLGGGAGEVGVQEDGILLGQATSLNFEGASVAIDNHIATVTITAGGPGGSDAYYRHDQAIASDVWSVHHSLGKHPSVTVVDSADTVLVGEVVYLDENSVELHFSAPFSGRAYLN